MATSMAKAPAGGVTSAVNGRFYNGGEFIPDHGRSCGSPSGKADKIEQARAIAGRLGWEFFVAESGDYVARRPGGGGYRAASIAGLLRDLKAEDGRSRAARPGFGGPW